MEDAPKLLKFSKSECPDIWIRQPKQVIENSKIGMFRHYDSSTTTQVVKIVVQYGRPCCSSGKESVRSSSSRTVMGKAIRKKFFWKTDGKKF